ncbi:MAG TPA: 50S ribosomal protein L22 [Candidatus Paceibacterota bacterium]|nr:50S ribosomal protein L22 [Candidatus Paceibacterota bacterium]
MKDKKQAKAKLSYLRISPKKVRKVADVIRGMAVSEAEAQLLMSPRRPSENILKLLRSAIANAENNQDMNPHKLFIEEIRVDEAPTLKRWRERAFGAINEIHKKMSHINIVLEEKEDMVNDKYIIPEKEGKVKDKDYGEKHDQKDRPEVHPEKEAEKPKERKGPLKKMFRRKSV